MKEFRPKPQDIASTSFPDEPPITFEFETTSPAKLRRERLVGRGITALALAFLLSGSPEDVKKDIPETSIVMPPLPDITNIPPELPFGSDTYRVLSEVINAPVEEVKIPDYFTSQNKEVRAAYNMKSNEKFVGIQPVGYVYEKSNANNFSNDQGWGWHVGLFNLMREGQDEPVPFIVKVTQDNGEYLAYFSVPAPPLKTSERRESYFLGYYSVYGNTIGINTERYQVYPETTYKFILDSKEELLEGERAEFISRHEGFNALMEYISKTLPASQINSAIELP